MLSATKAEANDVETPSVGGIVLGVETHEDEKQQKKANDDSSRTPPMFDTTTLLTTLLYSLTVVTLFVAPRLASNDDDSSGGWDGLLRGLTIIFAVGVGALIITTVSLVKTVRRWNKLHTVSKALGLFPTICTITIIILLFVLVSIQTDSSDSSSPLEPACSLNSNDCKNQTGSL